MAGNATVNTIKTRGFACSRIGTLSAEPDNFMVTGAGSDTIKNSIGTLVKILVFDTGSGQAALSIYDSVLPVGTPRFVLDLTDLTTDLEMDIKFNFGLSFSATGAAFQVMLVYR